MTIDDLRFFDSSLTAEQIEAVLAGVYNVTGLVQSDGHGHFTAGQGGGGGGGESGIITGYGPPTESTVGAVNQLYLDTNAKVFYVCTAATTEGVYTWVDIKYVPVTRTLNGYPLDQNRTLWANDIPYQNVSVKTALTDVELGTAIIAFMEAVGVKTTVSGFSKEDLAEYWLQRFLDAGYTRDDLSGVTIIQR